MFYWQLTIAAPYALHGARGLVQQSRARYLVVQASHPAAGAGGSVETFVPSAARASSPQR